MESAQIDKLRAHLKTTARPLLVDDGTTTWELYSGTDVKTTGILYRAYFEEYRSYVWKLKVVVNVAPKVMLPYFSDDKIVTTWMPNVAYQKTLEKKEDWEILHVMTSGVAGVADREFLSIRFTSRLDNGTLLFTGCNIPDEAIGFKTPFGNRCVRGESLPSGVAFESLPEDPNKCLITYIYNTDLKGSLPKFLINLAVSRFVLAFGKAAQAVANDIANGKLSSYDQENQSPHHQK